MADAAKFERCSEQTVTRRWFAAIGILVTLIAIALYYLWWHELGPESGYGKERQLRALLRRGMAEDDVRAALKKPELNPDDPSGVLVVNMLRANEEGTHAYSLQPRTVWWETKRKLRQQFLPRRAIQAQIYFTSGTVTSADVIKRNYQTGEALVESLLSDL